MESKDQASAERALAIILFYVFCGITILIFWWWEDARMKHNQRRMNSCHDQGGELYITESGKDVCVDIDAGKIFDAGE